MRTFRIPKAQRIQSLAFAPDGCRVLVLGSYEAAGVNYWVWLDPATGTADLFDEAGGDAAAATPALDTLFVAPLDPDDEPPGPVWWSPADGLNWETFPFGKRAGAIHVFALGVGPDPNRLVIAYGPADDDRHTVAVWQIRPAKKVLEVEVGDAIFGRMAFRPDGKQVALTGGPEGSPTVTVVDLAAGLVPVGFNPVGATRTRCLAYHPDGTRIAVGVRQTVPVLNAKTLGKVGELPEHPKQVNAIAFTPDGRRTLTACQDGAVRVWDADGSLIGTFDWKIGAVTCVTVAPDGLTAAAGGIKGKVAVWDLE